MVPGGERRNSVIWLDCNRIHLDVSCPNHTSVEICQTRLCALTASAVSTHRSLQRWIVLGGPISRRSTRSNHNTHCQSHRRPGCVIKEEYSYDYIVVSGVTTSTVLLRRVVAYSCGERGGGDLITTFLCFDLQGMQYLNYELYTVRQLARPGDFNLEVWPE